MCCGYGPIKKKKDGIYLCPYLSISIYLSIHLYTDLSNEILLNHKNEILTFATTWMDLDDFILIEVNKTEKDKHRMLFIYGI